MQKTSESDGGVLRVRSRTSGEDEGVVEAEQGGPRCSTPMATDLPFRRDDDEKAEREGRTASSTRFRILAE